MHNLVLSPIDPETLISSISDRVTENILKAVKIKESSIEDSEELLTVQETAQFLNLAVATIYSKVSRGELPVMKQGKRLYFSSTELMQYLKEGRKKTYTEMEASAKDYLLSKKS